MLTRVLPPKRVDLENPAETDEVEFVKSDVGPAVSFLFISPGLSES